MKRSISTITTLLLAACLTIGSPTSAQEKTEEELAKALANPLAAMISVPLKLNYDHNIGPVDDGERISIQAQPVVPFVLNDDVNLITRTILPLIFQDDIFPGAGSQSGLGDFNTSLFFSPTSSGKEGFTWGAGPIIVLPTASDDLLGSGKLSLGPTAVALQQKGPWTLGGIINHVWSVAGDSDRSSVNSTFVQPFVNYTTPNAWSFVLNTESTYDWTTDEWSVPIHVEAKKLFTVGKQRMQLGGGLRYFATAPDSGPEGLGFRITFTLLFPK